MLEQVMLGALRPYEPETVKIGTTEHGAAHPASCHAFVGQAEVAAAEDRGELGAFSTRDVMPDEVLWPLAWNVFPEQDLAIAHWRPVFFLFHRGVISRS